MKIQLQRMHKTYGRYHLAETCGKCCNLGSYFQQRRYYKCARYGDSRAESTDWAKSWQACGMFNTPLPANGRPLIEYVRIYEKINDDKPIDGQIEFFDWGEDDG